MSTQASYRFVFNGVIASGKDQGMVKEKLQQAMGLNDAQIDRLFSGKPVVIKRNLDLDQAKKLEASFLACGAVGEIKAQDSESPKPEANTAKLKSIKPKTSTVLYKKDSVDLKKSLTAGKKTLTGKDTTPSKARYYGIYVFVFIVLGLLGSEFAIQYFDRERKLEPRFDGVYAVQIAIENYVQEHHDYPKSLDDLMKFLPKDSGVETLNLILEEEGQFKVTDPSFNSELHYTPQYYLGRLQWQCRPISAANGDIPIECQSVESWKKNAEQKITQDKVAAIYLPKSWRQQANKDQTNLFYLHPTGGFIMVSEPKAELGETYGAYAKSVVQLVFSDRVGSEERLAHPPQPKSVANLPAIEYVVASKIDGQAFSYIITVIDGLEYYHRTVAWVAQAKMQKMLPQFRKITQSFEEIYRVKKKPYKARKNFANAVYEGELIVGEPAGEGVFQWENGDIAKGTFSPRGPDGKIAYEWKDEDKNTIAAFTGELDSEYGGQGEYTWGSGTFKGNLKQGLAQGIGEILWQSGAKYKGQFNQGAMHGYGVYQWPDGDSYDGGFARGKIHGEGICDFGGKRLACAFENGERVK